MNRTAPGETVVLKTDTKTYDITLAHHPENDNKSYLGVYVSQSSKIKPALKQELFFIPSIILWLLGLLYWLYLLNLGIGLFNLVPIGPIDGGRMLRRRVSPRQAKRMMQRMGLSMNPMPDVQEVIIRTSRKEITVENPEVAVLDLQGQKIFQVTGERITEKELEKPEKRVTIPEEDVRLVADQTGKSVEEAQRALEETEGDLAKAILLLQLEG